MIYKTTSYTFTISSKKGHSIILYKSWGGSWIAFDHRAENIELELRTSSGIIHRCGRDETHCYKNKCILCQIRKKMDKAAYQRAYRARKKNSG